MRLLCAAALLLVLAGLTFAQEEEVPVDMYGRPLFDALGRIEYGLVDGIWIAVHADGSRVESPPMPNPNPDIPAVEPQLDGYRLGTATYYQVGSHAVSVAIGDVTGDGRHDVLLTTSFYFDPPNDFTLFLFRQKRDGTLAPPEKYPLLAPASGDFGIVLADLDEDGLRDVVAGHSQGMTVFLADGFGGLSAGTVVSGLAAYGLGAIDVNLDGHVDIASLSSQNGLTIYLGDGDGDFLGTQVVSTSAMQVGELEVDDLNSDGRSDIAVRSGGGSRFEMTVHLHNGLNNFFPATAFDVGSGFVARGLGVGDVTGDGRNDVAIGRARNSPTWLYFWRQDPFGVLTGPTTLTTRDLPEGIEIEDMDGDGDEDIVVGHAGTTRMGIYFPGPTGEPGPEVLYPIPFLSYLDGHTMDVGDFNSDGCRDVAVASFTFGLIMIPGEGCAVPCVPTDCDDGNPCTDDWCDPEGCRHWNHQDPCDDGNACTLSDACVSGACVGSEPVTCVALDDCHTAGTCDPATGACSNPVVADGTTCDDESLCTTGETCQLGVCTPAHDGLAEPNPRTNGYYKRLCRGPHSGDELTDADGLCVATVAPSFAGLDSASGICAEIEPSHPNGDPCDRTEDDLMVLALNICRARVCTAQPLDSGCGDNLDVAQSLAEADAILSDPARDAASCAQAKCLLEEINTGHALELDTLTLRRDGSALRLDWRPPYLDDGGRQPSGYVIWRRTHGFSGPFVKIGATTETNYVEDEVEAGDAQYEVTPVME